MGNPLFDLRTLLPEDLAASKERRPATQTAKSLAHKASKGPLPAKPAAPSGSPDARAEAAWVKTDEDILRYYGEAGAGTRAVQFFFCSRPPETSTFAPYDLVVVPQQATEHQGEYFIVSSRQVVRYCKGAPCEIMALADWAHQKRCFQRLRQLAFFSKYYIAKYCIIWWKEVRQRRLQRTRGLLEGVSFCAKSTFCPALLEIGSQLARLRDMKACNVRTDRVWRLNELVEQQKAWREKKVLPEVEEAVGVIRQVAERVCSQAERAAQEARDGIREPSQLTDRIGVDLYAATTAARAKSMVVIKQEKIDRARGYYLAQQEVAQLPAFLRLVDLMLAQALADMAAANLAAALRTLSHVGHPGKDRAGDAEQPGGSGGSQDEEAAGAGAANTAADGVDLGTVSHGLLFTDVVFESSGITLSPSLAEWSAALEEQLVEGTVGVAAGVAPLASLPVFAKYCQPGEEEADQQGTGGGTLARQDPVLLGSQRGLQSLLEGCFAQASSFGQHYNPHRKLYDFHRSFDLELYTQKQRAELDLGEVRRDLASLASWRADLEKMHLSKTAGCVQVDARALRAVLEPMAAGDLDAIKAMLLQLAKDLCRQRLEDLQLRLHVACARPVELEDFVPWQEQVSRIQEAKETTLKDAAAIDDVYDVLAHNGVKVPTPDQVTHDDLKESVARLDEQLEGCSAFIAEQTPAHVESLVAQTKTLRDEASLLEESLKTGMYTDETASAEEVVADLEAVVERVGQMRAAAEDLYSLQAALRMEVSNLDEVEEAEKVAHERLRLWNIVLKAQHLAEDREHRLELAKNQAALAGEQSEGERPRASRLASVSRMENSLHDIATAAQRLEVQLGELGEHRAGPIHKRAADFLAACKPS